MFVTPILYKYVCYEMNVFFQCFHNHLPKIHRSFLHKIKIDILYWDVYDVNLWEKLVITVKLCFIETSQNKRNDDCFDNRGCSLFFLMNIFCNSQSEVFCKKGVLKISQNLHQENMCLWPATLFKIFLLSRSFLHFILKWQDCQNFTKLVPSQTSL